MCDVIGQAMAAVPAASRRGLLKAIAAGSAVAAGVVMTSAAPASAAQGRKRPSPTRLVLLGTAGGPTYMTPGHAGISTAIVHEDRTYLVDLGMGSYYRFVESGLAPDTGANSTLSEISGIFFTHLHSDHTTDWPAVYATGSMNAAQRGLPPIQVFGPGDRGTLARVFPPNRPAPPVVNPDNPTPGIADMTTYLRQAFSQDFNDRHRDSNFPDPADLFNIQDIDLTGIWDIDPLGKPPRISPFPVWEDGDVQVTATLVDHHPMAPSFAYRFDTPRGSVVVSGDTTVSENLIELAEGADYLVHEVIDPAFVERLVATVPPAVAGPLREHLLGAHTTIEQVGRDVAEPAGVKNLVLTHLVPVDNPISAWQPAKVGFSGKLIVGRDLMSLDLPSRR